MFDLAAQVLREADALVITAGAGIGVDSGLPDFRSAEGFWKAYPPFRHIGLEFAQVANPRWFHSDPRLAWGFYGHRLALYRRTIPHEGFALLRKWSERCRHGCFVFTSNVDGQFQRAGFAHDRIVEIHGSIHRLQPLSGADDRIWDAAQTNVEVDEQTMRVRGELPADPVTGKVARPNILMFGDSDWNARIAEEQHRRYSSWLSTLAASRLVVMEVGAGTAIPTVRFEGESLVRRFGARLIRINPTEADVRDGDVSIRSGALAALRAIALV